MQFTATMTSVGFLEFSHMSSIRSHHLLLCGYLFVADFGIENLINFKNKCNFPWLMSNVLDKETQTLLAEGLEYIVLQSKGKKVRVREVTQSTP